MERMVPIQVEVRLFGGALFLYLSIVHVRKQIASESALNSMPPMLFRYASPTDSPFSHSVNPHPIHLKEKNVLRDKANVAKFNQDQEHPR